MGVLDDKVAIVTGAGGGIGRGICLALAKEGASIGAVDIDASAAEDIAAVITRDGGVAVALTCDIRDSQQVTATVDTMVARFNTVDILVNNAQAGPHGVPLEDLTDADFTLALSSGPMATWYFMRACFPYLRGGGRIVNFRSASEISGLAGHGAYVTAKGATAALTKATAREWGKFGITANAINPFVLHQKALDFFEDFPEERDKLVQSLSIPRNGQAESDIGRAVVYLAGPDGSFVTGVTLSVDGGGAFVG